MAETSKTCVFISHSSHDRKVAAKLCMALEARGLDCWIAARDVLPGENYQSQIVEAISRSRVMVLVFSVNANNSDEIKKEIALAGQASTPVIPVRVEDVLPSGAFKYELATRQWIDLFDDWDGAIGRLAERIDDTAPRRGPLDPERTRVASRILPRALALTASAFALCAAIAGYAYWKLWIPPEPARASTADDPPAQYPETEATRLDAFTLCTPASEYKAGFRRWTRVAPDRWRQDYPDGSYEIMNVVARARASSIVLSYEGYGLALLVPSFLTK